MPPRWRTLYKDRLSVVHALHARSVLGLRESIAARLSLEHVGFLPTSETDSRTHSDKTPPTKLNPSSTLHTNVSILPA